MMEDANWVAAHQTRTAHAIHGIVSAVDPINHAVKVILQPDGLETGWLPDAAFAQAGALRISCPCTVGTQVFLMPVEGDGETFVIVSVVYDVVAAPAVSPHTGKVAQPGEMLVRAGYDKSNAASYAADDAAGWFHIGRDGVFLGAGGMRCAIGHASISLHAGDIALVFDKEGLSVSGAGIRVSEGNLSVSGGDVRTDLHSLSGHVHPYANGMTGKAVG